MGRLEPAKGQRVALDRRHFGRRIVVSFTIGDE